MSVALELPDGDKTPGRIVYETFCEHVQSDALVPWDVLKEPLKEGWEQGAKAAILNSINFRRMKSLFRQLSDEDRIAWLDDNFQCCRHCGQLELPCYCMRDE